MVCKKQKTLRVAKREGHHRKERQGGITLNIEIIPPASPFRTISKGNTYETTA